MWIYLGDLEAWKHCWHTGQVEEVGVLVELIEDGARAVFYFCSCQDGNAIFGEEGGKLRPALGILERSNSGGDWCFELAPSMISGTYVTYVPRL